MGNKSEELPENISTCVPHTLPKTLVPWLKHLSHQHHCYPSENSKRPAAVMWHRWCQDTATCKGLGSVLRQSGNILGRQHLSSCSPLLQQDHVLSIKKAIKVLQQFTWRKIIMAKCSFAVSGISDIQSVKYPYHRGLQTHLAWHKWAPQPKPLSNSAGHKTAQSLSSSSLPLQWWARPKGQRSQLRSW